MTEMLQWVVSEHHCNQRREMPPADFKLSVGIPSVFLKLISLQRKKDWLGIPTSPPGATLVVRLGNSFPLAPRSWWPRWKLCPTSCGRTYLPTFQPGYSHMDPHLWCLPLYTVCYFRMLNEVITRTGHKNDNFKFNLYYGVFMRKPTDTVSQLKWKIITAEL